MYKCTMHVAPMTSNFHSIAVLMNSSNDYTEQSDAIILFKRTSTLAIARCLSVQFGKPICVGDNLCGIANKMLIKEELNLMNVNFYVI